MIRRLPLLLLLLVAGPGCLTGRSPYSDYFLPPQPEVTAQPNSPVAGQELRLTRMSAASRLSDQEILWRASDAEVGFYELRRWLRPPVEVVELAFNRELFEGYGLRRSQAVGPVTVESALLQFEEQLDPHQVTVALWVLVLDSERVSLLEKVFTVTKAVPNQTPGEEDPAVMVRAMGAAMGEVVKEAAKAVVEALPTAG